MIEKSVVLPCPPEKAFRLFTERISDWWPPSHRPSKDAASVVRIEPLGRFCETASDGREYDIGLVREWQPPTQLVLDFYLGTDAQHPTAVTVRFTPDEAGTRVTVEHRPTEASRDLWDSRAPRYVAGWDAVLAAFIKLP